MNNDVRVACPCGHDPDRHDDAGCRGTAADYCDCRRQRWLALDAAIATPPLRELQLTG